MRSIKTDRQMRVFIHDRLRHVALESLINFGLYAQAMCNVCIYVCVILHHGWHLHCFCMCYWFVGHKARYTKHALLCMHYMYIYIHTHADIAWTSNTLPEAAWSWQEVGTDILPASSGCLAEARWCACTHAWCTSAGRKPHLDCNMSQWDKVIWVDTLYYDMSVIRTNEYAALELPAIFPRKEE
jgi:hypothetical protein